jgi:hypothetical protein
MKLNKFEDKRLHQINNLDKQLNERSIGNALMRLLFGSKFKKIMKKAAKEEKDFPEYQAALSSMYTHMETIEDMMKRAAKTRKALDKANRKR